MSKFKFSPLVDIVRNFNPGSEQWRVKKTIPKVGVGVFHGKSQSYKSFAALDLNLRVANGWKWAGKKTEQGECVYVASEGGGGIDKRIYGFHTYNEGSLYAPFFLTKVAPNLGTQNGDLSELIKAIEAVCKRPALITLDTISSSMGGADENGAGMAQFLLNAIALSVHFNCFVLCVHHVGHSSTDRMRGWSGLQCGIDVELFAERKDESLKETTVTIKKVKDEEGNRTIKFWLERIPLGQDEDGEDVTTLVVKSAEEVSDQGTLDPAPADGDDKRLAILRAIYEQPDASQRNWMSAAGVKSTGTLTRELNKLKDEKLVENGAGKWRLTPKGRRFAKPEDDAGQRDSARDKRDKEEGILQESNNL